MVNLDRLRRQTMSSMEADAAAKEITILNTDLVDMALAAKSFMLLVSKTNAERLYEVLARESVVYAVLAKESGRG